MPSIEASLGLDFLKQVHHAETQREEDHDDA
jgi:hypothetical protein